MKKILFFILLSIPALLHAQDNGEKDLSGLSFPELYKLLESESKTLKTVEGQNDKTGIGRSEGVIGNIYLNIAKKLSESSIQSGQIIADKEINLNKSIEHLNKSIEVSEEAGDIDQLRMSYKNLAAAQKLSGNVKAAMKTYAKMVALKKTIFNSKTANDIEKKQIEYIHDKREDSIRKMQQIAEEHLKEETKKLTLQQMQLDSANKAANKALTAAEIKKREDSLTLRKTQTDLTLEKQNSQEKEKKLTLAEEEEALQVSNNQLQESKLKLQQSELLLQQSKMQIQQNELHMKDKHLEQQRTYTYMGVAGILLLVGFSFFIIKERKEAIQQKLRAENSEKFKQQFLANMSHEIRTPMNAISGMTGLLIDKGPRPDQENYLKAISKSSEILLHVINDVLDLSKIEAGKLEFEAIDFSLAETIQQVKDTLSYRAEDKGLQLITSIASDVEDVVVGDPFRLNQILINIGGNALKFTDKGGVHIDVTPVKKEGGKISVKFSVTDTGIGIPADKISTLFENFTQVSSSDTRKYGGTGLGLSISKQLVELQGGTISVESTLGSGTTFYFILTYPIGSAEILHKRVAEEQNADGSILNGLRFLIADDNEYNRMVINETLHLKADVFTELVVNGKEAVEMVEKNQYDIVLMDVQMPLMSGIEATRYIRTLPAPKNQIPIIALTASVMRSELDLCSSSGMNGYVPKPFKPWQLIHTIADLTGRTLPTGNTKKETVVTGNKDKYIISENGNGNGNGNGKVTDLAYLTKFCEGDEKRIKKYIKVYLQTLPSFFEKVDNAIISKDFTELALHIHSFKPKWMMMGMKHTNELGIKIDMQCKEKNDIAFKNVNHLIEEVNKSIKELEDKC